MWLVGLLVYMLAVFHRSSLGVAGLAATERFDISAAQLATFTMLQLLVYAGMQIPVGLLVDRFGSRSVMLVGLLLMTVSQTGFALAESYPLALLARAGVGIGDAMTFICVLRLVSSWFPPRRIPFVTQLTGTLGQLGAVGAAVPMTWALRQLGWTRAYLVAASLGVVLGCVALLLLRDTPEHRHLRGEPMSLAAVRSSLAASWAHPGTHLGFWMHFSTQFSATVMSLLWGFPFFVAGRGPLHRDRGCAAHADGGLDHGRRSGARLAGRQPPLAPLDHGAGDRLRDRDDVDGGARLARERAPSGAGAAHPGRRRRRAGLDDRLRRGPHLQPVRAGWRRASGIINQGGFSASLILVVVIGLVLDWRTPGDSTAYTPEAFRWAMSAQYVLWAVGLAQIWRWRLRTRGVVSRTS